MNRLFASFTACAASIVLLSSCATPFHLTPFSKLPNSVSDTTFIVTSRHLKKEHEIQSTIPAHQFSALQGEVRQTQVTANTSPRKLRLTELATTNDEAPFQAQLEEAAQEMSPPANRLLLFVHGFNTSMRVAAQNAAWFEARIQEEQNQAEADYRPVVLSYAWPSKGTLTLMSYRYDRQRTDLAAFKLEEFLRSFLNQKQLPVDIIAHSLGTEVLLKALTWLPDANGKQWVNRVVLVAPDVETQKYEALVQKVTPRVESLTVYVNAGEQEKQKHLLKIPQAFIGDLAITASELVNHNYFVVGKPVELPPRKIAKDLRLSQAGLAVQTQGKPIWIRPDIPGVEMIETGDVVTELLGHNYYREPAVFEQILQDLRGVSPSSPSRGLVKEAYVAYDKHHRAVTPPTDQALDLEAIFYRIPPKE